MILGFAPYVVKVRARLDCASIALAAALVYQMLKAISLRDLEKGAREALSAEPNLVMTPLLDGADRGSGAQARANDSLVVRGVSGFCLRLVPQIARLVSFPCG